MQKRDKYNEMASRLYLQKRHGDAIINDPYFNPNFNNRMYTYNISSWNPLSTSQIPF